METQLARSAVGVGLGDIGSRAVDAKSVGGRGESPLV
jgi:hypothetical protein